MNKNVLCFGCSFTGGISEENDMRDCWPYRLSIMRPDLNFYNFARQGTSVLYSINLIEQIKQLNLDGKIISQITFPTRMTFYDRNFRLDLTKDLKQITKNYFVIPMQSIGVYGINGVLGKRGKKEIESKTHLLEKFQLLEKILMMQDDLNHFAPEFRCFVDRIKKLSHFVFFHRIPTIDLYDNNTIECVESLLGEEIFTQFVVDKGYHFGNEGHQWMAEWINDKVLHSIPRI